ncbi:uncharacterized protein LOC129614488 [Condylostylus longicornis]|uniref:uncharacterized protein LOC129614488 n=1 Tax=Condylostylus longicornis TaxID=2530218 RepID=UPI00244DCD8C|nr:uncharacterized protein LOC129614488 [Condylostylus longicornis]
MTVQQQQQPSLYSSLHHQNSQDHLKANLNNNVDKEDLFNPLFKTPSSSLISSQSLSSSAPSLSSSILSSILNGQLPIDEQDTYKLLQHLKSSSSEDIHHQSSTLSSSPTNLNTNSPPSQSSPSSSSQSSSPPSSTTTVAPSLPSPPISSSSSSTSFNSFISSIFPTLWAANNNFNSHHSQYKTDDNLKSRILPPIYIQPVVVPYPFIMNPMQNFISDYTSRFIMSGYSNDPSSISFSTPTTSPTMSSFADDYEKDTMARGNIRRSGINAYTNSPIYYVRLPSPTPITLYPTISYATNTGSNVPGNSRPTRTFSSTAYRNPFAVQINPPQPIQTIAAYSPQQLSAQSTSSVIPSLSPILNLPISFISNGKPNGIYELTTSDNTLSGNSVSSIPSAGDALGNSIQFGYHPHNNHHSQRIPTNHYSQSTSYNPFINNHQSDSSSGTNSFYRPSIIRPHSHPHYQHLNDIIGDPDSKITNLKRQYFFNGKPEEIYVLSQPASTENQYQLQHSIYPAFQTHRNDYY